MFHHFHGGQHPEDQQGSVSSKMLEELVTRIGVHNIVCPAEHLEIVSKGLTSDGLFSLSFDDALKSQIDIALPVLENFGLKAFWFINSAPLQGTPINLEIYRKFRLNQFTSLQEFYTNFIRRVQETKRVSLNEFEIQKYTRRKRKEFPFYTVEDIQFRYCRDVLLSVEEYESIMNQMMAEAKVSHQDLLGSVWMTEVDLENLLKSNHEIGLHSFSHPTNISRMSKENQLAEYSRNLSHLSNFQHKIKVAAHPCNSYSGTTLRVLFDLGISFAFKASPQKSNRLSRRFKLLELPREDCALHLNQSLMT